MLKVRRGTDRLQIFMLMIRQAGLRGDVNRVPEAKWMTAQWISRRKLQEENAILMGWENEITSVTGPPHPGETSRRSLSSESEWYILLPGGPRLWLRASHEQLHPKWMRTNMFGSVFYKNHSSCCSGKKKSNFIFTEHRGPNIFRVPLPDESPPTTPLFYLCSFYRKCVIVSFR